MTKKIGENDNRYADLVFLQRGVVENHKGMVAGFWIRGRKGKREVFLFEKPIKREKYGHVEEKSIMVNGRLMHNVPVTVCPTMNSFTHWGKYTEDKNT